MSVNRIPYISLLQAFAILCVIIGHVTRLYCYPNGAYWHTPAYTSAFFDWLARFVYMFHLPLLVFLSGYLAERSMHKNKSVAEFAKGRVERLLVPFWGWGLFYMVPIWIMIDMPNGQLDNFLSGLNTGHLWFLPMLFMVTMLYLLLRKLPQKSDLWILIALLCFYFLKKKYTVYFGLYRIPEFLFYFYLGAKFFALEDKKFFQSAKNRLRMLTVSLVLFAIAAYLLYCSESGCAWLELTVGVSGVVFFVTLAQIIARHYSDFIEHNRVIQFLSLNLFTVYVLHEPIMEIISTCTGWGNILKPWPNVGILFVGTITATVIATILYKFIRAQYLRMLKNA